MHLRGPRGHSGWSAVLENVRSLVRSQMVSLEFFIDIILPISQWPWGRLSLWQKWVPGGFPGGKGGRCERLTTLPPPCAVVMKSGNLNFLEPSGPFRACNGTDLPVPRQILHGESQYVCISIGINASQPGLLSNGRYKFAQNTSQEIPKPTTTHRDFMQSCVDRNTKMKS